MKPPFVNKIETLIFSVWRHYYEFNASVKFCFRLQYTVFGEKMQEGNGEKSKKVRCLTWLNPITHNI